MKSFFKTIVGFFVALLGFEEENKNINVIPLAEPAPEHLRPARRDQLPRVVEVGKKKLRYRSRKDPSRVLTAKITGRQGDTFEVCRYGMHFKISGREVVAA